MKNLILFICVTFLLVVAGGGEAQAAKGEMDRYWISSDEKYTKEYYPQSVKVVSRKNDIPREIVATIRTGYSYAGAKETLNNYAMKDIRPEVLAYSIATVRVCPSLHTLAYEEERFFDKAGALLWEKKYSPVKPKEINSMSFDEGFFAHIVDEVFGAGEVKNLTSSNRWLLLWQDKGDKFETYALGDTSTMRLDRDNLIYWEWQEKKNKAGNTVEIRFVKKAVNLPQATEKEIIINLWQGKGWQDVTDKESDGLYHGIYADTRESLTLKVLKDYCQKRDKWVRRYNLEEEE